MLTKELDNQPRIRPDVLVFIFSIPSFPIFFRLVLVLCAKLLSSLSLVTIWFVPRLLIPVDDGHLAAFECLVDSARSKDA